MPDDAEPTADPFPTPAGAPAAPLPWPPADAGVLSGLRGIVTDIDDTLTRDGRIDPPALRALGALAERGWTVFAVTGRPAGWSLAALSAWPLRAIVAENGAVLLARRPGGGIEVGFADDAATRAAHDAVLERTRSAILQTLPHARPARDSDGRITDVAIDHAEHEHLSPGDIERVVSIMQAHGLHATVSSIHVNGWLGGHDKWRGAQWAVRTCLGEPLDPRQWLAIGDSANDQALFAAMPCSVGVANVARWLPAMAHRPRWVTRGDRGIGFAEMVAALPPYPAAAR